MAISKNSQAYVQTQQNLQGITRGLVVVVDPSIGSSSSMPGWAVYREGHYVASGIFEINPTKPKPERLRSLGRQLLALYQKYPPDVLVYEEIPAQRHGFGNAEAHASLLKSLGVVLSVPGPAGYVGIAPISWKNQVRESYVKSDENDAVEMGWIIIELAQVILLDTDKKTKGKKNGKK